MPASQRVAVLVVRAWCEHDGPEGLRARITWVDDVEQDPAPGQTAVAAGVEDVMALARRWLESVAGRGPA